MVIPDSVIEQLKGWIRDLRRDASGESGRMSAGDMYAVADFLSTLLAAPRDQGDAQEMLDRVVAVLDRWTLYTVPVYESGYGPRRDAPAVLREHIDKELAVLRAASRSPEGTEKGR
jgi:hypothetical protein